jgi:GrpB-like predicted nucleotidyltransferase (UPF0157 family)
MNKRLKERIEELVREKISIVPYNPEWPALFEKEAAFLRNKLPRNIIKRIEHFGSTAVPGLSAKPIIDILVEVSSLDEVKKQIVPIMKSKGYEYFWRPAIGNQGPYYAWFIKRNSSGIRTHHIHMVGRISELWDRLYFRDYLKDFTDEAKKYDKLKQSLSAEFPNNRVEYSKRKTEFIVSITKKAKEYYDVSQA